MRPKLNAALFALSLRELQQGPCSANDLVVITGVRRLTVLRWVRALHDKGCVHVVEWERDAAGRWRAPVYALGEGRDQPKPAPMTRTQRSAKARQVAALRAAGMPA